MFGPYKTLKSLYIFRLTTQKVMQFENCRIRLWDSVIVTTHLCKLSVYLMSFCLLSIRFLYESSKHVVRDIIGITIIYSHQKYIHFTIIFHILLRQLIKLSTLANIWAVKRVIQIFEPNYSAKGHNELFIATREYFPRDKKGLS